MKDKLTATRKSIYSQMGKVFAYLNIGRKHDAEVAAKELVLQLTKLLASFK